MRKRLGTLLIVLLAGNAAAPASTPATTAREVLDRARELNRTTRKWTDRTQVLKMQIVDRRGGVREREVEVYYKKYDNDQAKSILFFRSPPEVKGTGFLQWVDPHSRNQQWLYLPGLKRIRQISGRSERDSFMGTDFSYEDLAIVTEILDWSESEAASSIEREEPCEESRCWVLLFVPKEKDVAYTKIRVWLDSEYRLRRFEFANKKDEVAKRLDAMEIRPVSAIPTSFRLQMSDLRSGSHTVIEFQEVQYNTGIEDRMFSQHRLEKGL